MCDALRIAHPDDRYTFQSPAKQVGFDAVLNLYLGHFDLKSGRTLIEKNALLQQCCELAGRRGLASLSSAGTASQDTENFLRTAGLLTSEIEAMLPLTNSADNVTLQRLLDPFLADPGVALEAWNKQPKEVLSKFRILLGDSVEEFVVDPTTGSYHIQGMQAGGGFVTTRHTCGGVQCCEHSIGVALAPTDSLHLSSLRGRSIRRAMRRSIRALAAASRGSVSDTASR